MWGADMDLSNNWMVHPIVVAAMNQRWEILKVLLGSAQNVNVAKHILLNGALVYFVTDTGVLDMLKECGKMPVPLVKLCRNVVRNCIRKPLLQNIQRLQVPLKIIEIISNA